MLGRVLFCVAASCSVFQGSLCALECLNVCIVIQCEVSYIFWRWNSVCVGCVVLQGSGVRGCVRACVLENAGVCLVVVV